MKTNEEFIIDDCVAFKHKLQENVRKAFKESGYTDYVKFINDEAKKSPLWGKGVNQGELETYKHSAT